MTGPDTPPDSGPDPVPDAPTAADLERAILGEAPSLRSAELAEAVGATVEDAHRLWRALGFPDATDQAAFTSSDREALGRALGLVRDLGLDFETVLRMTRGLGQTMSRLADWEVGTLAGALIDGTEGHDVQAVASPTTMRAAMSLLENATPHFDALLVYAWRRHLAAAIGRMELFSDNAEGLHVAQATVGFADLVAFSALSNELDEDQIGELVEEFETRCADIIAGHNSRVVKTLGDSVLFLESEPARAIDIAQDVIAAIGGDDRLPDVRIGIATGPVVLRMGDVFGPPVNLAARLTAVARRNRVIIDARTAELLPAAEFQTRALPARPMRGFGDVEPVTVRRVRPRRATD